MKLKVSGVLSAWVGAAALALTAGSGGAAAQSTTPAGANQQTTRASGDQEVTLTGCIQREADYRRSVGARAGGVAGTGVGAGNEFVLASASMATSGSATAPTSGAAVPPATATGGSTRDTAAYELTGPNEGQAQTYVGKRVEITGKLKASSAGPTGATGGPTNVPGNRDLELREVEVSSIRATTGTCTTNP